MAPDKLLTLDEFRRAKTKLVGEKVALTERHRLLEKNPSYWLEPTQRFVKSLAEATLAVSGEDTSEKSKLLKKTGSNLKIRDGEIQFEFRGAWKIIEKHGRIAQAKTAPEFSGAASFGKSRSVFLLAERGRFELPLPLRADRFSKPAHSAALPPLQELF